MKLIVDIDDRRIKGIKLLAKEQDIETPYPTLEQIIANGIPLDNLRAEIQTEHDGILWHYNDYDDGWSDALKWVLNVIDKYTGKRGINEAISNLLLQHRIL